MKMKRNNEVKNILITIVEILTDGFIYEPIHFIQRLCLFKNPFDLGRCSPEREEFYSLLNKFIRNHPGVKIDQRALLSAWENKIIDTSITDFEKFLVK